MNKKRVLFFALGDEETSVTKFQVFLLDTYVSEFRILYCFKAEQQNVYEQVFT